MDATATARAPVTGREPSRGAAAHVIEVLASEWCKFRTVRSTFWTLALLTVFNVVPAAVLASVLPNAISARQQAGWHDSVGRILVGLHLSQVAIGVLGVLVITSEYSSGMIRASLAAVPARRLVLAAKTTVVALAAVAAGLATCYGAYFVFQAFLPGGSPMASPLSDPGVARAVTGAGLYLAVLALFGLGLGAIVRSSAGAMTALFGLLFVPRLILQVLPASWQDTIGPYLPMDAGESVFNLGGGNMGQSLAPWTGFAVFCAYAAAALIAGFILIGRRDA